MNQKLTRAGLALLGVTALSIGLSACASDTTIDYTSDAVTVSSGETLVIDFGMINSSVGDGWVITTEPDSAILGAGTAGTKYLGEEGSTGGGNSLTYRFPAVGAGTTVIEFEYEFRGEVPDDVAEQETARIEVTVK
ncbi:hypothetical protein DC31_15460 [Microbacterium sp. CH12i]|uniref:hypothetical protein n=1 Tax=Microbacterium sp. CH12i TaxID=1479651 RepID=UPI000460FA73|nr:hypothetical protein [Microbacterium sp. CH12i]KDA05885.1 hypothetical protein DC31_15460 [Microbacterium sp. CH12i]